MAAAGLLVLMLLATSALAVAPPSLGLTATDVIGAGSGPSSSTKCPPSQTVICDPLALAFDSEGNLWVADGQDNRVLEFPLVDGVISATASAVIGQPNFTSSTCGAGVWPTGIRSSVLCFPDGLAFDSKGDLWVADGGGDRVVEYPLVDGSISPQVSEVIGPNFTSVQPEFAQQGLLLPVGLAFDPAGNLWVADLSNSRVLEFPLVDGTISVTPGAVIGQPSMSGSYCNQTITVAGQVNATDSDLCFPSDIAFDAKGDLWVADFGLNDFVAGNSRVLMFPSVGGTISPTATQVIGQPSFTGYGCNGGYNEASRATLCLPSSIAFDSSGNLWVDDSGNNRVVEFSPSGGSLSASAALVLGQTDYTAHSCNEDGPNATLSSLCRPLDIAFDHRGDLWVSDTDNYRIVEFELGVSGSLQGTDVWYIPAALATVFVVLIVTDRLSGAKNESRT